MTSDRETSRPDPPDDDPGQARADEPHGPCRRCGGLGGAHYLTCPLLQLPEKPGPQP